MSDYLWLTLPLLALMLAIPAAAWWERRARARQYVEVELVADLTAYVDAMKQLSSVFADMSRAVNIGVAPAMRRASDALKANGVSSA